jgi:hypothetical protein
MNRLKNPLLIANIVVMLLVTASLVSAHGGDLRACKRITPHFSN